MSKMLTDKDQLWNVPKQDMGALADILDPSRKDPEEGYRFSNGRKFFRPHNPYDWADDE